MHPFIRFLFGFVLSFAIAAPVAAQQGAADADPDPGGVEEIVVTAERREQSIQEVGQAIYAATEATLDKANIEDIHDLQSFVPSLHVSGGLPQPTLRGVGQDIVGPATDPGFILHTNGTYSYQLATALLGFYDVERVEVVPGPTGIEYGRASTGGTMNFIWKRPRLDVWELTGDVQVATHDNFRIRNALNIPLIEEKLAARISIAREWVGEPFDVDVAGQELSANALGFGTAVRALVRWEPTETFRSDLIFQWTRDTADGGYPPVVGPFPTYPAGQSPLFRGSPDYTGAKPVSSDAFDLSLDRRQDQRYETIWGQLIMELDLGPLTLRSNSNYQYFDYDLDRDQDGSEIDAERLVLTNKDIGFAQELTLASSFDGPVQFIVGANYQTNKNQVNLPVWDYQLNAAAASYVIINSFDPAFGLATVCGGPCFFSAIPRDDADFRLDSNAETELFGAFLKLDWQALDDLKLTLGGRYSYTDREFDDNSTWNIFSEVFDILTPAQAAFFGIDPASTAFLIPLRGDADPNTLNTVPVRHHKSWNSLDGMLRLEWTPTDNALLYGYVATGERHGGFNFLQPIPFEPEEITAYEVGAKTDWLDRRLIVNASVFYYDYEEKFANEVLANVQVTRNLGDASVFGAELQLWYQPTEQLRFDATVGWLDTEIEDSFLSEDNSLSRGNPTGFCAFKPVGDQHGPGPTCDGGPLLDLKGNDLSKSPEWTFHLGAEYDWEFARGRLTPRLDFYYRDEMDYRQFDNPLDRADGYTQTNLRVRWTPTQARWFVEGFVENLEDDDEIRTNFEGETQHRRFWLGAPRTFGLRFGWNLEGADLPFVN